MATDIKRSIMEKDLMAYKEKVFKEMEEHNKKKIEQVLGLLK